MTDNEIIKALECCMQGNNCEGRCPYDDEDDTWEECTSKLTKDALDLINRQRAEIEKWHSECENQSMLWRNHFESIFDSAKEVVKAEAVKEFAERLKTEKWKHKNFGELVCVEDIDNLVKEMVGEQK